MSVKKIGFFSHPLLYEKQILPTLIKKLDALANTDMDIYFPREFDAFTEQMSQTIDEVRARHPDREIRCISAPELLENNTESYRKQHRKLETSIIKQCDVVFGYFYENLPFEKSSYAKTAKKSLIHVYLPTTRKRIDELITLLPEKDKICLTTYISDCPMRDAGETLQISVSQARRHALQASKHIHKLLVDEGTMEIWNFYKVIERDGKDLYGS